MTQLKSRVIFVFSCAENRAVEGNLRFLNPCHFVTSPFRGTPTTPDGRVGRHLGSMSCEHLARECRGAEAPSLRPKCALRGYYSGIGSKPFAVLSKALPIGESNKGIISIS